MTEATGNQPTEIEIFERALLKFATFRYDLTLFVTGASALSARAVTNLCALCEMYLTDRYDLSVIDVHRNPELVASRGVLAVPTLMKDFPLPRRVLVGDLSDTARVLRALDISVTSEPAEIRLLR